eukprot:gnl/TRDRNA2_/TRDRNA2_43398_c0_seq1.p1 gnl/TRDRNA2_/TRDRNA2_43398_c0~~gnl/TRDRNA2_/TRDRNA2_43398_c0_seq1.p1  ORF type:complete len:215 (+),score=32.63 gnl/TRDRNA2_/TRDRNA2_43398_c0_seq1:59-703(+)
MRSTSSVLLVFIVMLETAKRPRATYVDRELVSRRLSNLFGSASQLPRAKLMPHLGTAARGSANEPLREFLSDNPTVRTFPDDSGKRLMPNGEDLQFIPDAIKKPPFQPDGSRVHGFPDDGSRMHFFPTSEEEESVKPVFVDERSSVHFFPDRSRIHDVQPSSVTVHLAQKSSPEGALTIMQWTAVLAASSTVAFALLRQRCSYVAMAAQPLMSV